jgi:hypothetical protein
MTEAQPVERVDTPIPEPPSVPGDGTADADALPDVLKLAEECLEDLREHMQSEGWTLEPGWRCEVKLRAKLTAVGPRSDKVCATWEVSSVLRADDRAARVARALRLLL